MSINQINVGKRKSLCFEMPQNDKRNNDQTNCSSVYANTVQKGKFVASTVTEDIPHAGITALAGLLFQLSPPVTEVLGLNIVQCIMPENQLHSCSFYTAWYHVSRVALCIRLNSNIF